MVTYVCINRLENLWANTEYILINIKGRRYKIIRRGEEYFIVTPEGKEVKVRNFSVDRDVAVVWVYDALYQWDVCEVIE